MAKMIGEYGRPRCFSCRSGGGPDCAHGGRGKTGQRMQERRAWVRDYADEEFDFWYLRHTAGWFFLGAWCQFYEDRYGAEYSEWYAEFGVPPGGWPVTRMRGSACDL